MSFVDVDGAFDIVITSWLVADGASTDITACMTDENLGTNCGSEIRAINNALRLEVMKDPATLTSLTMRLEVSGVMTAGDYAMLAYDSATGVTTTDKIVLTVSATGTFDFVATAGFISQLFDQGGGSFAIRIVPDLNGGGRISKSEGDTEAVGPLVTISGVTRDKDGAPLASGKVALFKVLSEGPPETYVFMGSTTSDGSGVYSFTVEGTGSDKFMVYAQKDGAPNVFDASDNTVVGV